MLEIQEKYKNFFSFILAILFAVIIAFFILPLNFSNNIDGFSELQNINLVFSNFLAIISTKPSPNQIFLSIITLTFLSLFFLFYRIANKFKWLVCSKTAICIGILFILLNTKLNDIFYFICFINIISSFISASRFAKLGLLIFTIILSPIFSILFLIVLYLIVKVIKLKVFYMYRYDLVLVDSFFFSITVLYFTYGFQWLGLFLNPLMENPLFYMTKFLVFVVSALAFLLSRKSYAS